MKTKNLKIVTIAVEIVAAILFVIIASMFCAEMQHLLGELQNVERPSPEYAIIYCSGVSGLSISMLFLIIYGVYLIIDVVQLIKLIRIGECKYSNVVSAVITVILFSTALCLCHSWILVLLTIITVLARVILCVALYSKEKQ